MIAALIIARARVAVEEAVLPVGIAVIAWDARSKAGFVVVEGASTLRIEAINEAVSVVVDPVAALASAITA